MICIYSFQIMSNQPKKQATNQVIASVLLKNAISSLEETVFNCKSIIKDVILLPCSSSATKQLLCVANQLNHIKTITKTIDTEISPYINIAHNTGYLHKRLQTLHSTSKSHHIPSTMNANLLPLPPSPSFVSCYPSILAKSACPSSVAKGFLNNGMIDERTKHWPDMKAILRTCKNIKLTDKEEENIIQLFPKLYAEQMEKGHLSDDFLEGLGFMPDRNFSGETVRRTAAITDESSQRAKCLSHEYQRDLRKRVLITKNRKQVQKHTEQRNKAIE
jgi:hypothetical protein